jgi:hypothetical protein
LSRVANEQHNPGEPMHWAKEKSTDEADAMLRHQLDAGRIDGDGIRHSAKVAWRALAQLQRELEGEAAARVAMLHVVERDDRVLTVEDVRRAAEAIRDNGRREQFVAAKEDRARCVWCNQLPTLRHRSDCPEWHPDQDKPGERT